MTWALVVSDFEVEKSKEKVDAMADQEIFKTLASCLEALVGSTDDMEEKLKHVINFVLSMFEQTLETMVSITDPLKGMSESLGGALKVLEEVTGVFEKKIAKLEEEITELKTTMKTRKHELEARNNLLAPNDQSASNDQLTEIQRERRVLVINDLVSQTRGETQEDRLTEEAFKFLRQHNPSLDVDDIMFVKKLKSYRKNSSRMLVEVSTADLAKRMVLVGRRNGANMRLGKPRSVRKFMKEQYEKCSDMNRAREDGCGYYFRIKHGTRIIRVGKTVKEKPSRFDEENAIRKKGEETVKERPSNLEPPHPSTGRLKKPVDEENAIRKKVEEVSKAPLKAPCNEVTPTVSGDNLVPRSRDGKLRNTGNTRKIGTNKATQAYMESKGKPEIMLYYDSKGNFSWTPNGTPVYKNKSLAKRYHDAKLSKGNQGEINGILNSLQN